jgi:hypothetical protein
MSKPEALAMEKKLALNLRRKGYAVWFNWFYNFVFAIVNPKMLSKREREGQQFFIYTFLKSQDTGLDTYFN